MDYQIDIVALKEIEGDFNECNRYDARGWKSRQSVDVISHFNGNQSEVIIGN